MKISILGVSRSGKTCYISAMAQILKNCRFGRGYNISVKENDITRQLELDENFLSMVTACKWPKNTEESYQYDFRVTFRDSESYVNLPSLKMDDYRGGVLTGLSNADRRGRNELINSFDDTAVILFLIDGITILNAMDELDKDVSHRGMTEPKDKLDSINQIAIMENIIDACVGNHHIPPMMLVITKSDVFASDTEYENGVELVKNLLPKLFSWGNDIFVGITKVSLGSNLAKGDDDSILGQLDISTNNNIHIPMLFAIYAYLDSVYEFGDHEAQQKNDSVMSKIRSEFVGKVKFYSNGLEVFAN